MFPSPVGDLIYILINIDDYRSYKNVSVPCRGLNLYTINLKDFTFTEGQVFPSPVGDLIYIRNYNDDYEFTEHVSVPCRGLNLYTEKELNALTEIQKGFRPLSGT